MPRHSDIEMLVLARMSKLLSLLPTIDARMRVLQYHLHKAATEKNMIGYLQLSMPLDNRLPDPGDGTR